MTPILVTGAAGFIGFHLAARYLDSGRPVVGLDSVNDYYDVTLKRARLDALRQRPGFQFVHADLADATALTDYAVLAPDPVPIRLLAGPAQRSSLSAAVGNWHQRFGVSRPTIRKLVSAEVEKRVSSDSAALGRIAHPSTA